jgi:hypothetical protein
MNVARFAGVGVLFAALAVACSGGGSRPQDGGAAGNDAGGDGAAGQGGGTGGGAAGQLGGNGGGGAAGCTLLSDNSMVGCDVNGIVTMRFFCPPSSFKIGSCPYGCNPFGSFAGFNPVTDCKPAPVDGGGGVNDAPIDDGCDGACSDARADADASATH